MTPPPSRPSDISEELPDGFAGLRDLTPRIGTLVRFSDEPAFVLRRSPWSETSLVVDLFTRSRGRVAAAARGACRPASRFRGLLNPFYPLLVSVRGAGRVKNLTDARWLGGLEPLSGEGLLSGFYLNELLLRLTAVEDPCPALFDAYVQALGALAAEKGQALQRRLRSFEVRLLRECGWGQLWRQELDAPCVVRGGELVPVSRLPAADPSEPVFSPAAVRAVLTGDFSDDAQLGPARLALRAVLSAFAGKDGFLCKRTLTAWQQI